MTPTQQTNNTKPTRSRKGNVLKLLPITLTLALVMALTSVSVFAHDAGSSVAFPLCPEGDTSTYTATCMGANLSTVYVYLPNLVVDKIYRYRFDITNKHKKNLDFSNQCEGLGFHGQHTVGEGHHGWTTFRAQSTTEVRTAQVKDGCANRNRIMYWNIEALNDQGEFVTHLIKNKHRDIDTNPEGNEHPWVWDQAFVSFDEEGVTRIVASFYFHDDIHEDDDITETYTARLSLESGTGCINEAYHLDTDIQFTEDDISQRSDQGGHGGGYAILATLGGEDCEAGTYYVQVDLWRTTDGEHTLVMRTDDEVEYPAGG